MSIDYNFTNCEVSVKFNNAKEVPPEWKQIKELKKDLDEALEYISMVVSNGDITECGVAHLFKKYYPEEYKEELKNKEDK